ncbi:MAG: amidohydrolase family protein, partial [Litorimonas sp.]
LGSLAEGKWADFVVLSGNPMEAEDVRGIEVVETWVAGRRLGESRGTCRDGAPRAALLEGGRVWWRECLGS